MTTSGGMTSHAAIVARGMGKPCICGAESIHIDIEQKTITSGMYEVKEGDTITIDGSSGEVIVGNVKTIEPVLSEEFHELMKWTDEYRKMSIRANADTVEDVLVSKKAGAEGVGLCRTEHMFFDSEGIVSMRQMILTDDVETRRNVLENIRIMQEKDFYEIFSVMEDMPVTVRVVGPSAT